MGARLLLGRYRFFGRYRNLADLDSAACDDLAGADGLRIEQPFVYRNLSQASSYGGEAVADMETGPRWRASASYFQPPSSRQRRLFGRGFLGLPPPIRRARCPVPLLAQSHPQAPVGSVAHPINRRSAAGMARRIRA